MPEVYIYGLIDPNTQQIRYVGKTTNLKKRLNSHIIEAKNKSGTRRLHWVRSLLNLETKPIIEIIETCDESEWVECEIFWIQYFKFIGCNLTNTTTGGEGMSGVTLETRLKFSAFAKERGTEFLNTPEIQERARLSRIGQKRSNESRKKMSDAQKGKKQSPELILKRTASQKGEGNPFFGRKHSEETKLKIRETKRLNPTRKKNVSWTEAQYEKIEKEYIATSPDGLEITVKGFAKFCRDNNLDRGAMWCVVSGKYKQHKGWKIRHLEKTS